MKEKNCPNCGAPYDANENKCPYCGTSYFDMSSIDFTNCEPFYLKIKSNNININNECKDVYITQLVRPILNCLEISSKTTNATDTYGNKLMSFECNRGLTTKISFEAIPNTNGQLMDIELI